jgi:hypothetical protein
MFRVRLADNSNVVLATWVVCSNKNMPLSGDEQGKSRCTASYETLYSLATLRTTLLGQSGLEQ